MNRPRAVFSGTVNAGNRGQNTLELAADTTSGIVTGLGSQFIGFPQVTVDAAANWVFDTSDTVVAGSTLTNSGTLSGGVTLTGGATLDNTAGSTRFRRLRMRSMAPTDRARCECGHHKKLE